MLVARSSAARRHARFFFSANVAPGSGPAMLTHVTSKMKPVESAVFTAYPLEVTPPPWSLSRLFAGAPAEYSPDLTVFALDHPAFGASPDSLWERLPMLHEAYRSMDVGDLVILVEPDEDRVVKMELTELGEDTCKVVLSSGAWVHAGSRSERVVERTSLFGGFPCTVLLPSTPARLLKQEIAGQHRQDLGMWPAPLEPESVSFLCGGEPVDDEVGIGRLMAWAKSEEVLVCLGDERIPWRAP